jgi:hypothetical protein
MVIIIAFIIALICSSFIVAAYFYQLSYQKKYRYDRLENNLESGVNLMLVRGNSGYLPSEKRGLFGNDVDSVIVGSSPWGAFDVATVRAYIQTDTLYKAFLTGNRIDSAKWSALYLTDEDRPMSVSGLTAIRGNVRIPKAGIRAAYVDNHAYKGDPKFVTGHIYNSERELPPLRGDRLKQITGMMNQPKSVNPFSLRDSVVTNSFMRATRSVYLKKADSLVNISLKGNLILYSDTTLVIDSSARISDVVIFAKSVIVRPGFKGRCQIFANDSIAVGSGATFLYPSSLGLIRKKTLHAEWPPKISIGERTRLSGLIFTYEKEKSSIPMFIQMGKKVLVNGQIYAQGIVSLKDSVKINGSVSCRRFLYQTSYTAYENYLINVSINSGALSPYYLTSDLIPVAGKKRGVLQWLEGK